jgi:hypothetical protein
MYEHQKRIIDDDPKKCGFWLGTGSGKTYTSLTLAEGTILGIAPKTQKQDRNFEKNIEKFNMGKSVEVLSKEKFRSTWEELGPYDTVIVDEVHEFTGLHPDTCTRKGRTVPKTSQLYMALRQYLMKHPPKRLYLMSATPATKPMQVLAILKILGEDHDYFEWRKRYYVKKMKGFRELWLPKNSAPLKQELAEHLKRVGYTGQLSDWFDVPEQRQHVIEVRLTEKQKEWINGINATEADPMVARAKQRTIENGILYAESPSTEGKVTKFVKTTVMIGSNKYAHLGRLFDKHKKLIVFCAHTGSVHGINDYFVGFHTNVFIVTGETKNRGDVFDEANKCDEGVIIIQASISAGYELPTFRTMVFFSKSYRFIDYQQALGRNLRANNLQENDYYHLVVRGGTDEACHKAIMSGQDFYEKVME